MTTLDELIPLIGKKEIRIVEKTQQSCLGYTLVVGTGVHYETIIHYETIKPIANIHLSCPAMVAVTANQMEFKMHL